MITDRTRTKYGRHRPYLIIELYRLLLLMFSAGIHLVFRVARCDCNLAVVSFSAVLYSTSYTVMSIPHTAMLPQSHRIISSVLNFELLNMHELSRSNIIIPVCSLGIKRIFG